MKRKGSSKGSLLELSLKAEQLIATHSSARQGKGPYVNAPQGKAPYCIAIQGNASQRKGISKGDPFGAVFKREEEKCTAAYRRAEHCKAEHSRSQQCNEEHSRAKQRNGSTNNQRGKSMSINDKVTSLLFTGEFNYGAEYSRTEFREMVGLPRLMGEEMKNLPSYQVRSKIIAESVDELQASEAVRKVLRLLGRHFCSNKGDYRVPLASENAEIARKYAKNGRMKIEKAEQLLKHTPTDPSDHMPPSGIDQIAKDRAERRNNR